MSATYKVEVLPSPTSQIGEGPHWDVDTQSLYYNDIYGRDASVHRFDYAENKTYSATIGKCRRRENLFDFRVLRKCTLDNTN